MTGPVQSMGFDVPSSARFCAGFRLILVCSKVWVRFCTSSSGFGSTLFSSFLCLVLVNSRMFSRPGQVLYPKLRVWFYPLQLKVQRSQPVSSPVQKVLRVRRDEKEGLARLDQMPSRILPAHPASPGYFVSRPELGQAG